jgi:hypothetical protein
MTIERLLISVAMHFLFNFKWALHQNGFPVLSCTSAGRKPVNGSAARSDRLPDISVSSKQNVSFFIFYLTE